MITFTSNLNSITNPFIFYFFLENYDKITLINCVLVAASKQLTKQNLTDMAWAGLPILWDWKASAWYQPYKLLCWGRAICVQSFTLGSWHWAEPGQNAPGKVENINVYK